MSHLVGYLAATAVIVFGVFVVQRLIRSWRVANGGGPASDDVNPRRPPPGHTHNGDEVQGH